MEEIKSVRVRKSVPEGDENTGSGDIKVTLFKDRKFFRDIRIVRGTQDGRVIWGDSEYSGSRYENQPDEYIIDDFIRVNTISKGFPQTISDNSGEVVNYYEIIQDPYEDKPPKIRNFGYDPYYLNNGAILYIEWNSNTSGKVWSNKTSVSNNSEEFQYESQMRDYFFYNLGNTQSADSEASDLFNKKREGEKTIFCIYRKNGINEKFYISEGEEVQVVGTNMMSRNYIFTTDSSLQKIYDGDILDLQIYNEFINRWNIEVPNYNVGLCNPDNIECEYIKYINPIKSTEATPSVITPASATSSSVGKFKLSVVLPDDLKLKVKEDLPSLKIYLGDIPSEFVFQDFDDFDILSDEYVESDFNGFESEEQEIIFLLQPDNGFSEGGGESISNNDMNAGGTGDKRFQKKKIINGTTILNGEVPDSYLSKLDFINLKIEKNASIKMNQLAAEFKKEFGKTLPIGGGYRTFKVQDQIFDWDLFNSSGKARKKGTNGGTAAAKPGTSLHGWGQAVDISGFGNGPGNAYFDWFEQNARKYNWINPAWAKVKGPGYEPWHWEYIGSDLFKGGIA